MTACIRTTLPAHRGQPLWMLLLGILLLPSCSKTSEAFDRSASPIPVSFNSKIIEGLYQGQVDPSDPIQVFETVFFALDDAVTVFPTENYYYFQFSASGKTISGNLRLDYGDRDEGILHFGYFEYDENGSYPDRRGFGKILSYQDGVIVEKLSKMRYAVAYKGKRVAFELNDVGMDPPPPGQIRDCERFVGPVFDESGLKFFLLYDTVSKHFFYMLNEGGRAAETFEPSRVNPRVLIGKRTGFAFFDDENHQRKLLVAIHGNSTARNNYYDGPFDQLPDNYVDQTGIQSLIEEAYPFAKGRIDARGVFLDQKGARLAITPYSVYTKQSELGFVESCAGAKTESDFYFCATPDFKQIIAAYQPTFHALGELSLQGKVSP